jgi:glycosyltransferase involved in cell wall biosynthesis
MRRLKILTWDSHPRYLGLLRHAPHEFVLAQGGRALRRQRFDLVLYQAARQYLDEQYELLSPAQRRLPAIYLEHEPPREHPVDSRHFACTPGVLVVHVSAWNRLMWDNGDAPTRVIELGLPDPGPRYGGELARGVVAREGLERGGRRLGADLLEAVGRHVPLERRALHGAYRFLFDPARHASPDAALIEAMMMGMPAAAVAGGVLRDGETGVVEADPGRLAARMRELLADAGAARALGQAARREALERFSLARFVADWNRVFAEATGLGALRPAA